MAPLHRTGRKIADPGSIRKPKPGGWEEGGWKGIQLLPPQVSLSLDQWKATSADRGCPGTAIRTLLTQRGCYTVKLPLLSSGAC